MSTLFQLLKTSARLLFLFPFQLFVLQSCDLLSEGLLAAVQEPTRNIWLYAAIVFPPLWFMTVFSTALTFDFLRQHFEGAKPSVLTAYRNLARKLPQMLKAEGIVGLAVILGLNLILPGLYFMTLYLFVPCLVMTRPKMPTFSYLSEASDMTRGYFWKLLCLSIVILILSLGLNEIQAQWLSWAGKGFLQVAVALGISLVLGAAVNTFLTVCFFWFGQKRV